MIHIDPMESCNCMHASIIFLSSMRFISHVIQVANKRNHIESCNCNK